MKFTKELRLRAIELKRQGVGTNKIFTDEGVVIEGKQKDYAYKMISKRKRNKKDIKCKYVKRTLFCQKYLTF